MQLDREQARSEVPSRRRAQISWYFYDWANSAFSTTVVTVFLGPYLTAIAQNAADSAGFLYLLDIPIQADAFFAYLVSLSVGLQFFFLPILGAIADYSQAKKLMLGLFAYFGAFATAMLYFVQGRNYVLGGLLFLVANLSFGASLIFYNAFLPDIATPEERDTVSARGWALGYLGGGLLLVLNLIFVQWGAPALGIDTGLAVRICLASAGIWWALFTLIPLLNLRQRQPLKRLPPGEHYLTVGFRQLRHTLSRMPRLPQTLLFLVTYLLYNDGIQTVIALAAVFGAQELGMAQAALVQLVLMVQFVAFFGALLFGYVARWTGTQRAIWISLAIWFGVVVYAYGFLRTGGEFFILAAVIALVLGGSQALSRSLFSQMIPQGQEAEYFSLYEVSERGTSWLGPFLFGLSLQLTGSYRIAILSIAIFFAAGLILLPRVNVRRAMEEAGNLTPDSLPVPGGESR
jgi:UMF1 family MFS transporter